MNITAGNPSDRIRILLLEDIQSNPKPLESMLTGIGYPVFNAASAQEILRHLQEGEFALLVLDTAVPGLNAVELAKTIRGRDGDHLTPILFITADYNEAEAIAGSYGAGIVDYLVKPVNPQMLCSKVRVFVQLAEARHRLDLEVANRCQAEEALRQVNQKLAEVALQSTESLQRPILTSMAEGIVVHSANGAIIDCNQRAEKILSLTREQILGRDSMDPRWQSVREDGEPFPGDEHPVMVSLRTGQPCLDVTMGLHLPGGNLRWISINAEPLFRDAGNQPCGTVASFQDITPRKLAEVALRESELRFSTIFHASPAAIGISRLEGGQFLDVNDAFLRLHGYSREEVIGHTSEELVLWQSNNRGSVVRELREKKRTQIADLQGRRKNGEVRDLLASIALIELAGEPCILGILTDVTERKRTEEALRKSEEQMRLFFERQLVGMAITSAEKGWLRVNDKLCQMLGYSREELGCIGWPQLTHPDDLAADVAQFNRMLSGEINSYHLEKRFIRKDGAVVWTDLSVGCERRPGGAVEYVLALVQDITERKQAENALRASTDQLRALAGRLQEVREEERTRIAREIHDVLAQELTRLKLDIYWCIRHLAQPLNEAMRADFQKQADDMLNATNTAITAVQKIATELRPVVLDSFGLYAAIEWQADEFTKRTGITCQVKVPGTNNPLDRDRSTALFRILQESLTNVARHAGATRVDVQLHGDSNQIILTIQDNGCGIETNRLADPRAIGLLGMRERASLLGGECEIASRPGAGTTVRVRMPI